MPGMGASTARWASTRVCREVDAHTPLFLFVVDLFIVLFFVVLFFVVLFVVVLFFVVMVAVTAGQPVFRLESLDGVTKLHLLSSPT